MGIFRRKKADYDIGALIAANAAANPEQFSEVLGMASSLANARQILSARAAIRAVAICNSPEAIAAFADYDAAGASAAEAYATFVRENYVNGYDREAMKAYRLQDSVAADAVLAADTAYDPQTFAQRNFEGMRAIALAVQAYTEADPRALEDYTLS